MAKEVTPEQIEMLDGMVAKARAAAEIIATYDQERVDRLCQAVAASVIDMKVWANLADEAVDETGLGDKVTKRNKRNKLKLILRDCLRQKSVGVIEEIPEKGIVKYAKPVGVIASLVPTTNPCLTPAGQVIYAIKARDVIICSPHPRAKKTTNKCINIIRETLVREGAPADIIQGIEEPSITLTQELMKRCDLVIATGAVRHEGASREYAPIEYPAVANFDVTCALVQAAKNLGKSLKTGVVQCKDAFYGQHSPAKMPVSYELLNKWEAWKRLHVKASEMESAALFVVADALGCRCGSCFHVIWNQEREAAGLDQDMSEDTTSAVEVGVEALRLLIRADRGE